MKSWYDLKKEDRKKYRKEFDKKFLHSSVVFWTLEVLAIITFVSIMFIMGGTEIAVFVSLISMAVISLIADVYVELTFNKWLRTSKKIIK